MRPRRSCQKNDHKHNNCDNKTKPSRSLANSSRIRKQETRHYYCRNKPQRYHRTDPRGEKSPAKSEQAANKKKTKKLPAAACRDFDSPLSYIHDTARPSYEGGGKPGNNNTQQPTLELGEVRRFCSFPAVSLRDTNSALCSTPPQPPNLRPALETRAEKIRHTAPPPLSSHHSF